jgi:hypothetical protein
LLGNGATHCGGGGPPWAFGWRGGFGRQRGIFIGMEGFGALGFRH